MTRPSHKASDFAQGFFGQVDRRSIKGVVMPKRYTKKIPRFVLLCAVVILSVGARFYSPDLDVKRSTPQSRRSRTSVFEMPVNFGKTHFIIGVSKEDIAAARSAQTEFSVTEDNCTIDEVYFSPDDDLQQKLIAYINNEKKGIWLAIFSFTDKEIAQALVRAKERGVDVALIADPGFLHDRYTKIDWLFEQGVPVFVYDPKRSRNNLSTMSNIMHHKFAIFLQNVDDRPLVWTGSFNFTKSARLSNQENVVVLSTSRIIKRYMEKFEQLKKHAIVHTDLHASYGRDSLRNKK